MIEAVRKVSGRNCRAARPGEFCLGYGIVPVMIGKSWLEYSRMSPGNHYGSGWLDIRPPSRLNNTPKYLVQMANVFFLGQLPISTQAGFINSPVAGPGGLLVAGLFQVQPAIGHHFGTLLLDMP